MSIIVTLGIVALYLAAVSLFGKPQHNAAQAGPDHSLDSFTGPWE